MPTGSRERELVARRSPSRSRQQEDQRGRSRIPAMRVEDRKYRPSRERCSPSRSNRRSSSRSNRSPSRSRQQEDQRDRSRILAMRVEDWKSRIQLGLERKRCSPSRERCSPSRSNRSSSRSHRRSSSRNRCSPTPSCGKAPIQQELEDPFVDDELVVGFVTEYSCDEV